MICPFCKEEGVKSRVYDHGGSVTLMACTPYYDEDGKHHHHDSNTRTHSFTCSNNHGWSEKSQGSCWCGWNKDKETEIIEHKRTFVS